ncbi:dTDP-4-dehydrorhamnose reductase [Litorivicinus lipolyticus]|uniref:dTDP-4-dehydrorhamnose reductase n=1 Tax=Litorivicinus lipolyticus TaxID=418701 RepID=A0A5Q2QF53_9GAMM|nr:dTDP-4-dehydrorhamnose reductase [Litorivicinus lipolyticus]QGG80637.1 dTDP-4-dehydrorhamnose reductase [Litorivicinus lipolyticus]
MRVLVTGKNGQVGRCLMDQGESYGFAMFGMSSAELDITNIRNVDSVISQIKPDLVINAAAYTAVDKAETDKKSAYAVNETGPKILAAACKKLDIPLFHISTDYVFDGESDIPYKETDSVNPTSIYGRSKLMGELAVRNTLSKFIILRTSWVFSEHGGNFVKTMVRMARERDRLDVVSDQFGGPSSAHGVAAALLKIAAQLEQTNAISWGIYHYCQKPYVSWHQFAQEIIERATKMGLVDHPVEIAPIPSSQFLTSVKRPENSSLKTDKLERCFNVSGGQWSLDLEMVLESIKGVG